MPSSRHVGHRWGAVRVYTRQRIMSRARSLCRQEAGAAGDDLPARFRAARAGRENVPLARRATEARGGGRNDGRDDREERDGGEREKRAGYVPADTFVALKQPLISRGRGGG